MITRKSRADLEKDDFRMMLPRWSEENFPGNLVVVDKIHAIAEKYGQTPSRVTLAWILSEHPTWFAIPDSRTIARLEANARAVDLRLVPENLEEIRKLSEDASV
ncbi:hypothetical protein HWV62_22640 [Athelia sp. TMB]|nr:hypothetical protein HWV62_22640 [Athelia sp. TMB]